MRTLVIEDNVKLAASLKKGLVKNGYAVDVIHNGEEAFEHLVLNHGDYDIVLLDLMLPGRSGTDITTSVRERGINVPIIIITALDETAHKLALLDAGADDYLVKPYSFEELLARMRAVTRRPTPLSASEFTAGTIRMNLGQRKLYVAESEVTLTTKEFAILEMFLRNQDQVLSREFILDHVWDYNFNSLSNVVDVHVKNLRKKLASAGAEDLIETVSGLGYRCTP